MVDETAAEGERLEALLQNFLRDGRLIRLPAKFTRRKEVLRYLAMRDFRPRIWYAEHEVNDILKAWCEGTDATDYVSVRRYLIDYHILDREDSGKYWLLNAWNLPADQWLLGSRSGVLAATAPVGVAATRSSKIHQRKIGNSGCLSDNSA